MSGDISSNFGTAHAVLQGEVEARRLAGVSCATLRHGEHIRVTLVLNALAPAGKRRLDIAAIAVGVAIAVSLAFFSTKLVVDSWVFNDISTSNDATPLWIPQIGMAAGNILLLIAFIDLLISRIRGDESSTDTQEQQRHE